jgi:hypothetical protein
MSSSTMRTAYESYALICGCWHIICNADMHIANRYTHSDRGRTSVRPLAATVLSNYVPDKTNDTRIGISWCSRTRHVDPGTRSATRRTRLYGKGLVAGDFGGLGFRCLRPELILRRVPLHPLYGPTILSFAESPPLVRLPQMILFARKIVSES